MNATATEVLDRVRVVDILGGLGGEVPKRGNRTKCPIHRGDALSFSINESKGAWYCHRCAEGGGKVQLVRRVLGCEPKAALQWIADLAGVPLAHWTREQMQVRESELRAAEAEGAQLVAWRDWVVQDLRELREIFMSTYYRAIRSGNLAIEQKVWKQIQSLDRRIEWHRSQPWEVFVDIHRAGVEMGLISK